MFSPAYASFLFQNIKRFQIWKRMSICDGLQAEVCANTWNQNGLEEVTLREVLVYVFWGWVCCQSEKSSSNPVWREPRKGSGYRCCSTPSLLLSSTPPLLIAFHKFSLPPTRSVVVFLHLHISFKHQRLPLAVDGLTVMCDKVQDLFSFLVQFKAP